MDLMHHAAAAILDTDSALGTPEPETPSPPLSGAGKPVEPSTPKKAPRPAPVPAPAPPQSPPPKTQDHRLQEFLADSKRLDCLLGDYLDGQLKLHNLAAAHHVTVVELIAILDHPDVVAILDALIRHAALQAERIAILVRPEAVEKLAELARRDPEYNTILPPLIQARSRETIRKAAAQIERISNPKPLRSATRPRVTPVAAVPPVGGEGSAPPTGAASHHPSPSAPSAPGNSPAGAPSLAPENPDPPPRAPRPCAACALPLR